jgi:hypothetical protein
MALRAGMADGGPRILWLLHLASHRTLKENPMHHVAALFVLLLCAGSGVFAQGVPASMSYQGYVTDNTGVPLDGTLSFTFTLYNAEFTGSALWSETHTGVAVARGLFNVILGRGNPANPLALPFDQQYWLGIRIGADPEMTPRVRLATSAYSFRARMADDVPPGIITDAHVSNTTAINANKLQSTVLTETDIVAGTGVTVTPGAGGTLTIAASPAAVVLGGDVTGPAASNVIAGNAVTAVKLADNAVTTVKLADNAVTTVKLADNAVTAAKIQPNIVSSVDGVVNDGGDIDFVAGANIVITPNDGANTITIAATGGGGGGFTLPYDTTITSTGDALRITNEGLGAAAYFRNPNNGSTSTVMAVSTGSNANSHAIYAHAEGGTAVYASSDATAHAIRARNNGTGSAILASAQANAAIQVTKSAGESGAGLSVSNQGSGNGIVVDNLVGQPAVRLNQSGAAVGLHINQTGSGNAAWFDIPSGNNTTYNCLKATTASTNGGSDALEVGAEAGNAIEGYNASASLPTALFYNTNASTTAPVLSLRSSASSEVFRVNRNGNVTADGSVTAGTFVTTATASAVNTVGKNTVVHAWARVAYTAGTCTIQSGYGVSSVTRTSAGQYTVTLQNAFGAAEDICPIVTCRWSSGFYATVSTSTTSTIMVETYNTAGTQSDCSFSIVVFGLR